MIQCSAMYSVYLLFPDRNGGICRVVSLSRHLDLKCLQRDASSRAHVRVGGACVLDCRFISSISGILFLLSKVHGQ